MDNNSQKAEIMLSCDVYISSKLQEKIDVALAMCPRTEWCSHLIYREITPIKDIKMGDTIKLEAVDMLPVAGGDATYCVGVYTGEIADYVRSNNYLRYHKGWLHSHHKMEAFFSPVDLDTLRKETFETEYPFYLSLVVSSTSDYVAKFTWKVKESSAITTDIFGNLPLKKSVYLGKAESSKKEDTVYSINCKVIRPTDYTYNNAYEFMLTYGEKILPTNPYQVTTPKSAMPKEALKPKKEVMPEVKKQNESFSERASIIYSLLYRAITGSFFDNSTQLELNLVTVLSTENERVTNMSDMYDIDDIQIIAYWDSIIENVYIPTESNLIDTYDVILKIFKGILEKIVIFPKYTQYVKGFEKHLKYYVYDDEEEIE